MPKQLILPLEKVKPAANQPRKVIDAEEDRQLTESIRQHGILQPPGILPDGTLLWGQRRIRCGLAAGLKESTFMVLDKPMTETEVRILSLTENIQRLQLSDAELYLACKELLSLNPRIGSTRTWPTV